MEAPSSMLWLCAAMLVLAASALSAFHLTQRSYRGFAWWICALWLNAAGSASIAWLGPAHAMAPTLQLMFMPWPLLCVLGLRRFHARSGLVGSQRTDLVLLAALLLAAPLAARLPSPAEAELMPLLAASTALLYAALVAWSPPDKQEAPGLTTLGALWLAVALVPALVSAWDATGHAVVLQAGAVAIGSVATAFALLTLSSQRTERDLRRSRRRLRTLANIDMLTQVPNRRRFEELAQRALQADEDGSAALLLVDIDHFKQINDQLGHAAGDRALKLVSRCTLELLRAHDVAGRHGGDEFVMLLRRSSTQEAMQVANRLVGHLQQQAHAHALPRLTLSFGIVQMRRGESIDDTLQRADLALYEAKRLGRSRAVAAEGDPDRPVFHSSERLGLTSS